jgi:hypothetical protein
MFSSSTRLFRRARWSSSTMLCDLPLCGIHSAVGAIIEATLGKLSIAGIVCVVWAFSTIGFRAAQPCGTSMSGDVLPHPDTALTRKTNGPGWVGALMARSSGSTFLENSNIGFPVVVCGRRFSLPRTISNLLHANRSLSHANRVSGRAFTAHRETDFGRQRRRAPIRFRTVFVSRRDRERAMTPAPNRGKSRVFRGDGELGVRAGLRGGAGRTRTGNQTVMERGYSAETGNSGLAQNCMVGAERTRTGNQTVIS